MASIHTNIKNSNQHNLAQIYEINPVDQPETTETCVPKVKSICKQGSRSTVKNVAVKVPSEVDQFSELANLLRDYLSLPSGWTFHTTTDAVILSIKITFSCMLEEAYKQYAGGDAQALEHLKGKLSKVTELFSDLLLAEMLKGGQGLEQSMNEEVLITSCVIDNYESPPNIKEKQSSIAFKEIKMGCNLEVYQILLISNLIQLVSNKCYFIQQLLETVTAGYNLQHQQPFIYSTHPKYMYQQNSLDVLFEEFTLEYGFEFQGALEDCYLTISSERSLHWLACGVNMFEFGFVLSKEVYIIM